MGCGQLLFVPVEEGIASSQLTEPVSSGTAESAPGDARAHDLLQSGEVPVTSAPYHYQTPKTIRRVLLSAVRSHYELYLIAIACLVVVGLLLYVFVLRDTWEIDTRPKAREMNEEAMLLVSQEKVREGAAKYQEVIDLLSSRKLADTELQNLLADARTARSEAEEKLFLREWQVLESKAANRVKNGDLHGGISDYEELLRRATRLETGKDSVKKTIETLSFAKAQAETQWQALGYGRIVQLTTEAGKLMASGDLTGALARYSQALELAAGKDVRDPYVAKALAQASQSKASLEGQMAAQRAAEERKRLAEEERKRAEDRRRSAMATAVYKKSPAYAGHVKEADRVQADLRSQFLAEDSAWRAISAYATASRKLLAIYVKMQGELGNTDLSSEVGKIMEATEKDLLLEDSALRAIYKNDHGFMEILGAWCRCLEPTHPGIMKKYESETSSLLTSLVTEDSAYRADSSATKAAMTTLAHILAAKGYGFASQAVIADIATANVVEDSAVRAARKHAEGITKLLLLLVEGKSKARAGEISRSVLTNTVTDNSAIRVHSEWKRGAVDAIYYLIVDP
jgi:hypothetical protein